MFQYVPITNFLVCQGIPAIILSIRWNSGGSGGGHNLPLLRLENIS